MRKCNILYSLDCDVVNKQIVTAVLIKTGRSAADITGCLKSVQILVFRTEKVAQMWYVSFLRWKKFCLEDFTMDELQCLIGPSCNVR